MGLECDAVAIITIIAFYWLPFYTIYYAILSNQMMV